MKFVLGQKLGMTRVFDEEGKNLAVSMIKVLPCFVSQVKSVEKDGYSAVQLKAVNKQGDKEKVVEICEFKAEGFKKDDKVSIDQFEIGDMATITGTSKGKGFAGTIKRHSFKRGPETHGGNNVREPGSIGAQQPQRVVKGRKMAGRMGGETVTVKNLRIVEVGKDTLLVAGAIPGPRKGILKITANSNVQSEENQSDNE